MRYLFLISLFLLGGCASFQKPVWSLNYCEVGLVNKCVGVCKVYKSKVDDFSKVRQEYVCSCNKDLVATFRNACE